MKNVRAQGRSSSTICHTDTRPHKQEEAMQTALQKVELLGWEVAA
jgi:hypothetical protein